MKLGTYAGIAGALLLTLAVEKADAQTSSCWPPYQTTQPYYRPQGRIVKNNTCPIRIPENEVADPNDKVAIHKLRKEIQDDLRRRQGQQYKSSVLPDYSGEEQKPPRQETSEPAYRDTATVVPEAYPTEPEQKLPEEKPEPAPVRTDTAQTTTEPVTKTDTSTTALPTYREKDTYEFGYSGKVCPEQFVPEANSLLNYLFDGIRKDGKQNLHAYAFKKKGKIYTGIRNEENKTVLDIHFSEKPMDAKEFVLKLENDLTKIDIKIEDFLEILYRDYSGQCGQ